MQINNIRPISDCLGVMTDMTDSTTGQINILISFLACVCVCVFERLLQVVCLKY